MKYVRKPILALAALAILAATGTSFAEERCRWVFNPQTGEYMYCCNGGCQEP
jgi:hypothetical protein